MNYAYLMLACACLSVPALATVGCAVEGAPENEGVGTMRMPLRAVSADGTEYRLRQATFEITGSQNANILSEDYLTSEVAEMVLGVGNYQVELTGIWQMERIVDGLPEPVDATHVSENPVPFMIQDQGVTAVTFRFEVDGEIIETGEGVFELRIEVEEVSDEPGPDPGTLLWTMPGPGQLPMAAVGLPGDRVAATSGPATRFAVDENGLFWQASAGQPSNAGQDIAAGGTDEVLTVSGGAQVAVESFSANDGSSLNYVSNAPSNGIATRPVVAHFPSGGAVYAVGSPGNTLVGRVAPDGTLAWMSPAPGAGAARDIEVTPEENVLALFGQNNGAQASLSALDLNGSLFSVTSFPVAGRVESLRQESSGQAIVFASQGTDVVAYPIDTLTGSSLGPSTLASFPMPVVDIEPGANDLLAVATQDSLLHVFDAALILNYSVSVPGGNIQDVVFLPDSNAVCAVASNGNESLTSCYAN